ncbi:hypothetical protein BH10ACT1_BH10ACT1_22570 [soil metagenome]
MLLGAVGVVLAVASVTNCVVSVGQIADARDEQDLALEAATTERTRQATLDEQLARLEAEIGIADDQRTRDAADASALADATSLLARLRARVRTVQAELTRRTEQSRRAQQPIDLLVSCQRTMELAAAALRATGGERLGAAVVALEGGRDRCQQALTKVRGMAGPSHPYDFADPFVLPVGADGYLAFGTNGPAGTIQVLSSTDLGSWQVREPALAGVPAWAEPGSTWAPSVAKVGAGWILYYAVRVKGSRQQCISTAGSWAAAGPYIDQTSGPLVCQSDLGGSIDPSTYRDEFGFQHLLWKSEDEVKGGRSRIWTQFLGFDGRSLGGAPAELLVADDGWENRIIENPSMAKLNGQWVLLYSGNRWNTADYATGYAVCAGFAGPCTRPPSPVVLQSDVSRQGPGGGDLFRTNEGVAMAAYAAWDPGQVGFPNARRLRTAQVAMGPLGLTIG